MDCNRTLLLLLSLFQLARAVFKDIPDEFWNVVNTLKGPNGVAIKAKIHFENSNTLSSWKDLTTIEDLTACHHGLLNTMRDELGCPRAADALSPHLDILEYRYNLTTKDEKLLQNYFSGNCTWLDSRSAKICAQSETNVELKVFTGIIDDCYLERWGAQGNVSSPNMRSALEACTYEVHKVVVILDLLLLPCHILKSADCVTFVCFLRTLPPSSDVICVCPFLKTICA